MWLPFYQRLLDHRRHAWVRKLMKKDKVQIAQEYAKGESQLIYFFVVAMIVLVLVRSIWIWWF